MADIKCSHCGETTENIGHPLFSPETDIYKCGKCGELTVVCETEQEVEIIVRARPVKEDVASEMK